MRIIGGKDYYDHGLAYGQDDDIVFVRTGSLVPTYTLPELRAYGTVPRIQALPRNGATLEQRQRWDYSYHTKWQHNDFHYEMEDVHVIFCGRYYSGVRVHRQAVVRGIGGGQPSYHWTNKPAEHKNANWRHRDWESQTFWDLNSLSRYLAKCGVMLQSAEGKNKKRFISMFRNPDRPMARKIYVDAALQCLLDNRITVATLTDDDTEQMVKLGDKFSSYQRQWRINEDTLKDVDFIKVLDPMQAFQQISQWVGGVLPRPGNPMVQITDDAVKLAKHGMDPKWSFRKPPASKERRNVD